MSKIRSIKAREILSSGSTPSIEVKLILESGAIGKASVPYGASAGIHEAYTLLDQDKKRYKGKGMLQAVQNINTFISERIVGLEASDQKEIDKAMIELDGTRNKSSLGANAILGVSLAAARAAANEKSIPLYRYIRKTYSLPIKKYILPNPMMVMIEGGRHADDSADFQEYLIAPMGKAAAKENIRMGIEIYLALKKILKEKKLSTNVGNEGAFAPKLKTNEEPLKLLVKAIKNAGYKPGKDAAISLDPAASVFFKKGKYILKKEKKRLNAEQLIKYFEKWVKKYPIIALEDPLHQDDWENWKKITRLKTTIVGDDLTVTNPARLLHAIKLKAINAVIIKPNQIGTLTETVETCILARKNSIITIVSHRGGGETDDTSIIDLAVAVNSAFVKVGPSRGERVEKYNRLMEIEDELGNKASVAGKNFAMSILN